MKVMAAYPSVIRNHFNSRLALTAVLGLLIPHAAHADRPRVRPHHRLSPQSRQILSSTIRTISFSGTFGSQSSSSSYSSGASVSAAGISSGYDLVKAGTGAVNVTAGNFAGGTLTIAGNTFSGGAVVNMGSGSAINFPLNLGTASAGTLTLASSGTNLLGNGGVLGTAAGSLSGALVLNGGASQTLNTGVNSLVLNNAGNAAGGIRVISAFTGPLVLNAGTLSLSAPVLPDPITLTLATGVTLNLNFLGTDTVNRLIIDGIIQAPGTWGSLTSDAANKSAYITGTGLLDVTSDAPTTTTANPIGPIDLAAGSGAISTNAINSGTLILQPPVVGTTTLSSGGLITQTGSGANAVVVGAPSVAARTSAQLSGISPVPEPSTAILFAMGAGWLSLRRRRG